MIISRQKLELRCLIIDMKYVNKQMMNMYINKKTTAKAGFNQNTTKNFINVKMTFKNIFHNLIHIDFAKFVSRLVLSFKLQNTQKTYSTI